MRVVETRIARHEGRARVCGYWQEGAAKHVFSSEATVARSNQVPNQGLWASFRPFKRIARVKI
jgi:hypothetical protein